MIPDLSGKHIALVALGPSSEHYIRVTELAGDRKRYCDETWTINTYGSIIAHDRLVCMDDVRLIMRDPNPKMQAYLEMLKRHPGPVYTSRAHPDFPCLVEYPLEEVINEAGFDYLNNTVAYAIALIIAGKPKRLDLFGVDFVPMDSHDAPAGRECCEYWIGRAHQRGIVTLISPFSTLLDSNKGGAFVQPLYGYETRTVERTLGKKTVMQNGKPTVRDWVSVKTTELPEADWPPPPDLSVAA